MLQDIFRMLVVSINLMMLMLGGERGGWEGEERGRGRKEGGKERESGKGRKEWDKEVKGREGKQEKRKE